MRAAKSTILRHFIAAASIMTASGGCMSPDYFFHVAGGELRSLSHSHSIDHLLAGGRVTNETASKLELVRRVRLYARDRIGMKVGRAYTTFEEDAKGPVAYAVSGARKDKLEPHEWNYPIIGKYEAKGFFDRAKAEREADRLSKKGYDAAIGEVAGFSTMGILPDPIRASNLEGSDAELAILVFHELTHNTIFKAGDTQFNESMATFMGRAAAKQFFSEQYAADAPEVLAASRHLEDLRVMDEYVTQVYERLLALYGTSLSADDKISRREAIFEEERERFGREFKPRMHEPALFDGAEGVVKDNATVLAAYRYHSDLSLYDGVLADLHGNLKEMISVLRKAAAKRDSFGYLKTLNARGAEPQISRRIR
ncbi:MAG TPA: aminopeptidase [Phycisphaerae bacterium]|nr:aminopeptidase [Phycisphaerae bacterium]